MNKSATALHKLKKSIKQVNFKFAVYYNGGEGKEIRLLNEKTVETVVLLSKGEIGFKKIQAE